VRLWCGSGALLIFGAVFGAVLCGFKSVLQHHKNVDAMRAAGNWCGCALLNHKKRFFFGGEIMRGTK